MKEVNYIELLSKEIKEEILDLRSRAVTIRKISLKTDLTSYVIKKFLLQIGKSVPDMRFKENKKRHIFLDNLPKQPFSTNENDYGLDYPIYKESDLCFSERMLFNNNNHKELKQL